MAFLTLPHHPIPILPTPKSRNPNSPHFRLPNLTFTSTFNLHYSPNHHSSSSATSAASDAAILEAIDSNPNPNSLPCLRSYETDSAKLTLTGSVHADQALTAAAADGGFAAQEHLDAGLSAMVVETLFPGCVDDDSSTVSTRLFLPAKTVKEKARELRSSLPKDILSNMSSKNILAMTFRQVVLQQIWNFDLELFVPGSLRDMEDLETPREVTKSFALSSSNDKVISALAEALCSFSFELTHKEFLHKSSGKASRGLFNWFSVANKFSSKDSSIIISNYEDMIIENAKNLLDKFKYERISYPVRNKKQTSSLWSSPMHSKFEKIGGSEFSVWMSEYVPVYKIEVDADKFGDLKFEGWERTVGNRWEVFLTHSQMVGLANLLDMYFEDAYTLPDKQLLCKVARSQNKMSKVTRGFSLLHFLRTTVTAATLLLTVGVMVKIYLPHLSNASKRDPVPLTSANSCELRQPQLEPSQVEAFCSSIVGKIKIFYGWDGELKYESSIGAWIGELPIYLKNGWNGADPSSQESIPSSSDVLDIASYQVVMSKEGKVVGFQPTSGVAVNHWSSNPIAKELYDGKKLSPGLVEPSLKIKKPDEVIVLELLMSSNQENCFALARPC